MADPKHKQLPGDGGLEIVLVTPHGQIAHRKVDAVTAFGALGEFQVLPGHIPYLTLLDTGVLVLEERGARTVYAHGPGFLQVGAMGAVEALCERAQAGKDIDGAAAKAELEAAELELKKLADTTDAEWKNVAQRRSWALAQLEARARA